MESQEFGRLLIYLAWAVWAIGFVLTFTTAWGLVGCVLALPIWALALVVTIKDIRPAQLLDRVRRAR